MTLPTLKQERSLARVKRTLVLTDFMLVPGGAERVTLELTNVAQAQLYAGFIDIQHFPQLQDGSTAIALTTPTTQVGWQVLKAWRAFAKAGDQLPIDADTLIYSGAYCLAAALNHSRARHVLYCHTPPRFIYDLRDFYLSQATAWQKPLLKSLIAYLQPRYEAAFQRMDQVIANSEHVQRRIKHYLDRDARVIHPPCDTQAFRWLGQQDYYLSTARLEPYKRVELVVRAFMQMPHKKLLVASGGSQLRRLQRLAEKYKNIQFTGWLTDSEIKTLLGNAIATIYLPVNEDFGLSPIESMAAGKPVIGVEEGGLLETVNDPETGVLIPTEPSVDALMNAIEFITPHKALAMRHACEKRAQKFDRSVFRQKIRSLLQATG